MATGGVTPLQPLHLKGNRMFKSLARLNGVAEVENDGMDEGRFFVHLKEDYEYPAPYQGQKTKSFGSVAEARKMLKCIIQKGN